MGSSSPCDVSERINSTKPSRGARCLGLLRSLVLPFLLHFVLLLFTLYLSHNIETRTNTLQSCGGSIAYRGIDCQLRVRACVYSKRTIDPAAAAEAANK